MVTALRPRWAPPEFRSPRLNIDHEGFRVDAQRASAFEDYSSRDYNIFVFGGSTMFGLPADDDNTIAAHLARVLPRQHNGLPVRVYNLGQPGYRLRDEAYLLIDLLKQGRRPSLAVFYDGVNEQCFYLRGYGPPDWDLDWGHYIQLNAAIRLANERPVIVVGNLPLYQLAVRVRERLRAFAGRGEAERWASGEEFSRVYADSDQCAGRYVKEATFLMEVARQFGFEPVFILQASGAFLPNATAYPFPRHGTLLARQIIHYKDLYRRIVEEMHGRGRKVWDMSLVLNAAAGCGESIFSDWQHLSARGNEIVAAQIAAILRTEWN